MIEDCCQQSGFYDNSILSVTKIGNSSNTDLPDFYDNSILSVTKMSNRRGYYSKYSREPYSAVKTSAILHL